MKESCTRQITGFQEEMCQGKSDFFMAGVCQKAYGNKAFKYESTCRAVKCNVCMLIGDGFQDEMVTT